MDERVVTHGTFVIERKYGASPERVFGAFADAASKRRWFAEGENHEVEEFEMEFGEGGRERVRSRLKEGTPFPGAEMVSEAIHQDIVPNRRIVLASTMRFGGRRISASLLTFEFLRTEEGTTLIFTDQGAYFEGADGPQMREQGWRQLLERLAKELDG